MSDEWWRGSVTYQIYPRSFQDDTGSGTGDLGGIVRRLGHVADLGVDAIWLSPFYASPMVDMGYDVANHRDVDPSFGTLADFDALVAEAHRLGLRVIVDQVLSHSSDRHPFFVESRSSRTNRRADWYLWRDAKPDGSPPNNWQSVFGGPAWTWDVRRRQFYYHSFLAAQPDFDFHQPEVQDWALDTLRFWLDRGVDGFRLDAVNFYAQDAALRDNPADHRPRAEAALKTFDMQRSIHSKNQPEMLAFAERMRALVDGYGGRVLVGEIGEAHEPAEMLVAYTKGHRRLHTAYNTALMGEAFDPAHVRREVEAILDRGGAPTWAFWSHDHRRHVTRWAAHGADQDALARLCCALLLSLPGAVCLYQGEELGLAQADLAYEDLVDPEGLTFWPDNPGRDGCRTPMPWERDAPHAGFSTARRTWLPLASAHRERAVDTQRDDPGSVLAFYRRMIALRRAQPDLRTGATTFLDAPDPVLAFRRGALTCAFNLGHEGAPPLAMPATGVTLIASEAETRNDTLALGPNGFVVMTGC